MTTVEDAVAGLLKTASRLEGNASVAVIDLVLKLQSALVSKENELRQELTARHEEREDQLRNSYNSTIQSLVREHRLENQHQADMRESGKRRYMYPATHVF